MAEANGNVKSTLKKPLFCAEWKTIIPSNEGEPTFSPVFYLKSIQCQFKLLAMMDIDEVLFLEVVRSNEPDIDATEWFWCTVVVTSDFDLKLPPPVRKRINLPEEYLWEIDISGLKLERMQGKTISFLVVLEEDGESTQEREGDWDWSLSPLAKSLHSLSGDFARLLYDQRTADVKLTCGGFTIPAHGSILSARSEVFEKMLQTDMVVLRTGLIEIPDIKPQIIKDFLRYLYTGTLPEMTVEKASRLYEAGDKYNVPSLVADCNNFLGISLAVDSACDVLVLADNHGDSDLKKRAIDFIAQLHIPLMPDIWKKFSDERPKLALEAMQCAYEYKCMERKDFNRR